MNFEMRAVAGMKGHIDSSAGDLIAVKIFDKTYYDVKALTRLNY